VFSIRSTAWQDAQDNPLCDNGWFLRFLRCPRKVFEVLVSRIENAWTRVHSWPHHNTKFWIRDRVACCFHFLGHVDGYDCAGLPFGIRFDSLFTNNVFSKTMAFRYTYEVVKVLNVVYKDSAIHIPSSEQEWAEIMTGFEVFCGFPGVCGAVDGTVLVRERYVILPLTQRPHDHDGWYSHKGQPSFNVQCVVDHRGKFISYSIRSGSQNDKQLFNRSWFGQHIHQCIPENGVFVADSGYKLFGHILTPYPISPHMSQEDKDYNFLHSSTRMRVEMAFGRLKSRFRLFKASLNQKTPEKMAEMIEACLVLHNWFIDLEEFANNPLAIAPLPRSVVPTVPRNNDRAVDGEDARIKRDAFKEYLQNV
jgi:hypothetical protein